ncbi:MAG TPA: hypothetical protein VEK79_08380 [Thermoanaerobaculia bacterium]|nr:hypothetical protein [Thermoanaerobaculia bacterium]
MTGNDELHRWSDPDEMLGLLVEYVADEAATSHGDPDRNQFLSRLLRELDALAVHDFTTTDRVEVTLREVIDSQPGDFASDPVIAHLEACVEELRRIRSDEMIASHSLAQ